MAGPFQPYACLVCAYMLGPYDLVCGRCRAPRGMVVDPNAEVPGTFAPVDSVRPPAPWAAPDGRNREKPPLPPSLERRWNWGAFWLPFLWGLNHHAYQTLIVLMFAVLSGIVSTVLLIRHPNVLAAPLVTLLVFWVAGLPFCIWFGMRGNGWAWRYRDFQSVEQFEVVQNIWAAWAKITFWLTIATAIAGAGGALLGSTTDTLH